MGLEIINILKKQMDLTNEQLSSLSGVPKGTIDKITAGATKDPKLGTLKAIAKVLHCSLNDFDDDTSLKPKEMTLTNHEQKVINKYRGQPAMQPAVDKLLGVEREDDRVLRQSKEVMELSTLVNEEEVIKSKHPL